MSAARKIMQRIETLAKISEASGNLTRTFASPAMRRANELVAGWMREAGMKARVDAIGNLTGHYDGEKSDAKILLLGSHLDTVRNAGKFDGPLGVILAIACVENLHRKKMRLPFAIEVIGFSDEEGVRYQTACLGSKALAGCFDGKNLQRKDADGISMADAIKNYGGDPAKIKSAKLNPKHLLGYIEAHIEQGPVLEEKNLAVGIVSAIAGQTRARRQLRRTRRTRRNHANEFAQRRVVRGGRIHFGRGKSGKKDGWPRRDRRRNFSAARREQCDSRHSPVESRCPPREGCRPKIALARH